MELKESLKRLDIEQLEKLARELGVGVFKDNVKVYLERKISERLTNLDYLSRIIEELDRSCIMTLTQLVYFNGCNIGVCLDDIRRKGLIYEDIQVPEDLKQCLGKYLYPKVKRNFKELLEVRQTPFLKLTILIGLIYRGEIDIKKLKNTKLKTKFKKGSRELYVYLDKDLVGMLIEFLEKQRIIYWENRVLSVNQSQLLGWFDKSNHIKVNMLYNWLKDKNKEVFELISVLSKIQNDCDDWIDTEVFIEGDIPCTKESIEEFGLVSFTEKGGHYFLRLTPEGWYYIKREYPDYWYSKSILVSADFEVFIPHDFDPDVIFFLDRYGQLKDNDYFLVYDIDPSNLKKEIVNKEYKGYKKFIKVLEAKSINMPQVVSYEMNKFLE